MTTKKTATPKKTGDETLVSEMGKAMKKSFVEQELLVASVVQKELMTTIKELNTQIGILNHTINLVREHEFVELHKSKWRIIAYQIALGILFAIGTVLGLALFSWATYTFFKDNEILRQIVDKQLSNRNFNLSEIRDRATKDATPNGVEPRPSAPTTASGSTASGVTKN